MFLDSPVEKSEKASLQRGLAAFAGSDPDDILHRNNEDFAVAKLACSGGLRDCLDDGIFNAFGDDNFDLDLWDELDLILRAAIGFRMSLLTAITLNLPDGHPAASTSLESFSNLVKKGRLIVSFNLLHQLS